MKRIAEANINVIRRTIISLSLGSFSQSFIHHNNSITQCVVTTVIKYQVVVQRHNTFYWFLGNIYNVEDRCSREQGVYCINEWTTRNKSSGRGVNFWRRHNFILFKSSGFSSEFTFWVHCIILHDDGVTQ